MDDTKSEQNEQALHDLRAILDGISLDLFWYRLDSAWTRIFEAHYTAEEIKRYWQPGHFRRKPAVIRSESTPWHRDAYKDHYNPDLARPRADTITYHARARLDRFEAFLIDNGKNEPVGYISVWCRRVDELEVTAGDDGEHAFTSRFLEWLVLEMGDNLTRQAVLRPFEETRHLPVWQEVLDEASSMVPSNHGATEQLTPALDDNGNNPTARVETAPEQELPQGKAIESPSFHGDTSTQSFLARHLLPKH